MTTTLERLDRRHRKLLDEFQNDVPELVVYLRRWSLAHQERDHLSTTWLAIHTDDAGLSRIAGYFSLAAATVDRSTIPNVGDLARLPRFPVPAILIARFAVDSRVQRQGVGAWLFEEVLQRSLGLAMAGPIAVRLLVTDAKDDRAIEFYAKRGMSVVVDEGFPRRMVLDLRSIVGPAKTRE